MVVDVHENAISKIQWPDKCVDKNGENVGSFEVWEYGNEFLEVFLWLLIEIRWTQWKGVCEKMLYKAQNKFGYWNAFRDVNWCAAVTGLILHRNAEPSFCEHSDCVGA